MGEEKLMPKTRNYSDDEIVMAREEMRRIIRDMLIATLRETDNGTEYEAAVLSLPVMKWPIGFDPPQMGH